MLGPALELRMELDAHMEGPVPDLHCFHQAAIRRGAAEHQPRIHQRLAIVVIELIAVPVALVNHLLPIAPGHGGPRSNHTGVGSQPQGSAPYSLPRSARA